MIPRSFVTPISLILPPLSLSTTSVSYLLYGMIDMVH